MASKAKEMDRGSASAPEIPAPPGMPADAAASDGVAETGEEVDASTGATPGVSTACKELGLDDMDAVLSARGIKPPGVS